MSPPSGLGRVPDFLLVFAVFGRSSWAPGRFSYPRGLVQGLRSSGGILSIEPPCTAASILRFDIEFESALLIESCLDLKTAGGSAET